MASRWLQCQNSSAVFPKPSARGISNVNILTYEPFIFKLTSKGALAWQCLTIWQYKKDIGYICSRSWGFIRMLINRKKWSWHANTELTYQPSLNVFVIVTLTLNSWAGPSVCSSCLVFHCVYWKAFVQNDITSWSVHWKSIPCVFVCFAGLQHL